MILLLLLPCMRLRILLVLHIVLVMAHCCRENSIAQMLRGVVQAGQEVLRLELTIHLLVEVLGAHNVDDIVVLLV